MARARRKKGEEQENLERWLVSYADFITLLFAFFVVMYSISSVNEGKYRVLSESIYEAFRAGVLVPKPGERREESVIPAFVAGLPLAVKRRGGKEGDEETSREARVKAALEATAQTANAVRAALAPMIENGDVRVTEGAFGVTIDVGAEILFPSGSANLSPVALSALRPIARVLAQSGDFPIQVEGHTDNVPLRPGAAFPSNWELSAARAAAVVRFFVQEGVDPSRLAAVGYADQRPIADNLTPQGRARNRRVTIRLETMAGLDQEQTPVTPLPPSGASILPPSLLSPPQ
jgi:chemotaxis protein MotB